MLGISPPTRQLGDLEFRIAKLKAERIELVRVSASEVPLGKIQSLSRTEPS